MSYGPLSGTESKQREVEARRKRKAYLEKIADEYRNFLLWAAGNPRAFVVFRKSDLKALRKPCSSE